MPDFTANMKIAEDAKIRESATDIRMQWSLEIKMTEINGTKGYAGFLGCERYKTDENGEIK